MSNIPQLNQPWPEQGGIYVGSRLENGVLVHVVAADLEHHKQGVEFDDVEKAIPAELNGHNDWVMPTQEDLMLAYINARERFPSKGMDSLYWTKTVTNGYPWAVDFESGRTYYDDRRVEYRVCPVRRLIASSI